MTYKELENYRVLIAKIKAFKLILSECGGIKATCITGMPRSGTQGNPTEKQALLMAEIKLRNETELKKAIEQVKKIRNFIDGCQNEKLKTYMQFRFYLGTTSECAAAELGYKDDRPIREKLRQYIKNY